MEGAMKYSEQVADLRGITCFIIALSLLFISMISVPATAQDKQGSLDALEQLMSTEVTTVIGASKYQQDVTDAPASISIVTSDDSYLPRDFIMRGHYRRQSCYSIF
jgi:hypothetical protein